MRRKSLHILVCDQSVSSPLVTIRMFYIAELELFRSYNPNKNICNLEIELIHDLEPIYVLDVEAQIFKLQHMQHLGRRAKSSIHAAQWMCSRPYL